MNQQQEQPKQDFAKYNQAGPGYATPPQGNGQTPPPPPYAPLQQYPATQYAPYPYRRTRGPVLPMLIIAALIVAVLVYGLGTLLFGAGKSYNHDFAITAATPATLHINSDSIDLKLISSTSVANSLSIAAKGIGSYDTHSSGNDITFNVNDPGGFAIFGFGQAEVDVTMPPGSSVDLHTGSGNVNISQSGNAGAGNIKIQSGSGDLNISGAQGDINLQTGSGNIKVSAASPKQNLTLHTDSGDISYSGDLAAKSYADSGSGNVTMNVGANNFQATLDSGSGNISNDFGLTGSDKHVASNAATNSANLPSLTVKTGSGDIKIAKGR